MRSKVFSVAAQFVLCLLVMVFASFPLLAVENDELPTNFLLGMGKPLHNNNAGGVNKRGNFPTPHGFPQGVDTLVNFTGHFEAQGVDSNGAPHQMWEYSMVGNSPDHGGTTTINAPIVAVTMDLRNFDGSPRFVNGQRLISSAHVFVQPVLDSPVFSSANFSSSNLPTQISDAIQKAEFGNQARPDWHTLLNPVVKTERTMVLIRGTYRFALNADGTCCRFILVDANTFVNALFPPTFIFPPDNSTVIGAAERAGDITTKDISTFLFPNTYLYFNGNPNDCCVLGFHTFDFEPGDANNGNQLRFFVANYSSWISPGLFGAAFTDVTAVSHEISETYNDPFVSFDGLHNQTPWWLSPNGNCQNNLEVGDVIEGLPNATYPITMPNGFTYHPQNEALLPWFEFAKNSFAIDNAYSYPDETTLTSLSAPQKVNCL